MAFDPVQRLIAIGAKHGYVRLLGQAGVDYALRHDVKEVVSHIQFLINEVRARVFLPKRNDK